MALTREQYNRIMRIYDERRMRADAELEKRREEAFERFPKLKACSDRIAENAVEETRALLKGEGKPPGGFAPRQSGSLRKRRSSSGMPGFRRITWNPITAVLTAGIQDISVRKSAAA